MTISKTAVKWYLSVAKDARLSYKDILKYYPGAIWIEDTKTDTQAFCFVLGKKLIFSFRGSQQIKDWFNDFDAFHLEIPYNNSDSKIRVHKGFLTCYKSIREQIHFIIKKKIGSEGITGTIGMGHSLGGALNTLFCIDAQYNFEPSFIENKLNSKNHICLTDIDTVFGYSSGNPKVGNDAFAKSFNIRLPRFIRTYVRSDVVPFMPPTKFGNILHGGYKHCGAPNPIGPHNFINGLKFWFKYIKSPDKLIENLTNHSIELYKAYAE
jgi:hypothetical protein